MMSKSSRSSPLSLFLFINKRSLVWLLALVLLSLTCMYIATCGISAVLEGGKGKVMWWGGGGEGEWELTEKLWRVIAVGAPRGPNKCGRRRRICGGAQEQQEDEEEGVSWRRRWWRGHFHNPQKPSPPLLHTIEEEEQEQEQEEATSPKKNNNNNNTSTTSTSEDIESSLLCPNFFQWIQHDFDPWRKTGILHNMLISSSSSPDLGPSFRVVIKHGKLFAQGIGNCYQTRAIFSLWGLLQLLRFYPGLVPDVDFLLGCGDTPLIPKGSSRTPSSPPIFRYCTTHQHFDIPFPDWSFWGWPEVNIQPWEIERRDIEQGASKMKWMNRIPKAYWRGNVFMGDGKRMELTKCNSDVAEIVRHNWDKEVQNGYKSSKLSSQCKHRYKVYLEGIGWSVSLKYILACDSPTLLVEPKYLDFFARGLIPRKHFWSVPPSNLCSSIESLVHWGNNHTAVAMELGELGSGFVKRELSMAHVYDFMLHTLREYAKLQQFVPTVEDGLDELCVDAFLCVAPPRELALLKASMVQAPSPSLPCFLPSSGKPSYITYTP